MFRKGSPSRVSAWNGTSSGSSSGHNSTTGHEADPTQKWTVLTMLLLLHQTTSASQLTRPLADRCKNLYALLDV